MARQDTGRYKPIDVKVRVSTGEGVDVVWADGHRSHYEFAYLRDHCPCAVCNDESRRRPVPPGSAELPLYKPKVTARAASAVGHYALQFDFSDGHATGIYSFEMLRDLCPCDECHAATPRQR